ncbi:hypothetical protein Tco_0682577 [Tanacetum coccineum]|uniref:Uncharacterized protein n=1 Tax=Tanacetum coccineum TaxID=301880 RepID=A0ABQ4XRL0_9ASTR
MFAIDELTGRFDVCSNSVSGRTSTNDYCAETVQNSSIYFPTLSIDITPTTINLELQKWTQAHSLENIIVDKYRRPVLYQEIAGHQTRYNILIIPAQMDFPKLRFDEYGDVLKNKARFSGKRLSSMEAGIDVEEHFSSLLD